MGSAGSGQFGNYRPGGSGAGGGTGMGIGPGKTEKECPDIIEHVMLEDIGTSQYYKEHDSPPQVNDIVNIRRNLYQNRLVVEVSDGGMVIGNMPTAFNTLLVCLKRGIKYSGFVESSGTSPVPYVVVTLNANT